MIGDRIIELSRVDSTNSYASQVFANTEFVDGTIIWAHDQFAGRGQHNNIWKCETGKNLTFTVCLKPRFLPPDRQFKLNKAIALGVIDFIRCSLYPVQQMRDISPVSASCIKWPNDIYVGEQKIGGILIENTIMGSIFETSFVGIGVNINQTHFASDIPNPVSLINILGHETVLKEALLSLCNFLNIRYMEIFQTDMANLDLAFDQTLLGFDHWRYFLRGGDQMEGKIKGVDDIGRLRVESRYGETHCFGHKEIEFVLDANNARKKED